MQQLARRAPEWWRYGPAVAAAAFFCGLGVRADIGRLQPRCSTPAGALVFALCLPRLLHHVEQLPERGLQFHAGHLVIVDRRRR